MTVPSSDGLAPVFSGGIVACGDGPRVARAIRSLLAQDLPHGGRWLRLWVVVAPGSGETLAAAQGAAAGDGRVVVLPERVRRGKSAALGEIFARTEGDYLVLLNGDAEAEPGSLLALWRTAAGARRPFAVMARPVPSPRPAGPCADAIALLWEIHHRLHLAIRSDGPAANLSDELLLLPVAALPPLGPGVINDGAFYAAWIRREGGELLYAPTAAVRVATPVGFLDHFRQRRRILAGHAQVAELTGLTPATVLTLARARPRNAIRLVGEATRSSPRGLRSLAALLAIEAAAHFAARFDRRRARAAIWPRVRTTPADDPRETDSPAIAG